MKKLIIKNLFITLVVAFIICLPVLSFAQNGQTSLKAGNGQTSPGAGNGQTSLSPGNGQTSPDTNKKNDSSTTTVKITNPIKANNINELLLAILQGAIQLGIPVIALAIIYSGFLFVEARGNSEKLGKAKSALLYTLIGAAILLGAWTIAQLISDTILQIK